MARPRKPQSAPAPQGARPAYVEAFEGLTTSMTSWLREKTRLDSWVNTITGLGGSRDRTRGMAVSYVTPIPFPILDALYHGSDLAARIVEQLPTDALSEGVDLGPPALNRACSRFGLVEKVLEARTWARLYGAGGILIDTFAISTGQADSPLRLESIGVGDLIGLTVLDRSDLSVAEWSEDGEILMWRVGRVNVHPSRVVVFGGAKTTPAMRIRNGGFDLSVLQRPYDVLADLENSWRSIMNLVQDMSQATFAIKGLMEMISQGRKDVVLARMEVADIARSSARAVVVDADGESFTHTGAANVTGVDPVLMRVFQRAAAAANMPLSIFLGMSAAGLNATGSGETDLRMWYRSCKGERKALEPGILYLGEAIARSEGMDVPKACTWPSLWDMTEVERATLDNLRADAAVKRINATITDSDEEAEILMGATVEAVLAKRPPTAGDLADDPADETIEIPVDSIWIDTVDGHRLQVKRVAEGKVYVVDLDAGPEQFAWVRRSFLERCTPAPETEPAAPAAPGPAAPVVP